MPYVQLNTNLTLDSEQINALLEKATALIVDLPNKTPERTMCEVNAGKAMRFGGNCEPCAMIHLELYKASPLEAKQAYVTKLTEMINEVTGIPQDRIYMTILEHENWVAQGQIK